jgi:outer membrane protein assembly factor BamB
MKKFLLAPLIFVIVLSSILFSQTLLNLYELPNDAFFNSAYGLASDSSSLWISSGSSAASNAGSIIQFDLEGNQTGSIATGQGSSQGLAWTGAHFWYFKRGTSTTSALVKIAPDGSVVESIPTGTPYIGGLCWDGSGLWYSLYYPNNEAALYKLDVVTRTVVDTIPTFGSQPQGIAFDGQLFYYAMDDNDGDPENIYIYDPAISDTVGLIPITDPISTRPRGLAWDGQYLWLIADPVGAAQRALFKFNVKGGGAGNIAVGETVNFGLSVIAEIDTAVLTILNTGSGSLKVSGIALNNPHFWVDTTVLPITIPANSSAAVQIYFLPDTTGMQPAVMTIESNDPAEPTVTVHLIGRGVYAVPTIGLSETEHDYGEVWVSREGIKEWMLDVVNESVQPLMIDQVTNADSVFFTGPLPALLQIAPGDTFSIPVFFSPKFANVYVDTLILSSTDTTVNAARVALRGTGIGGNFTRGYLYFEYQVPDHPSTNFNEYRPLALKTIDDVTGDGIQDVVLCTRNYWTICLDGASAGNAIELWRFSSYISSFSAGAIGNTNDLPPQQRAMAIVNDLDGDGYQDAVIGTGGGNEHVYAINGRTGQQIWTFGTDDPTQYDLGDFTSVAGGHDYNGDGVDDILATASATDGGINGRRTVYIFDGTNGTILWSRFVGSFLRMGIFAGDLNNNGSNDVVVGTGDGVQNTYAFIAYDPLTNASIWNFPVTSGSGGGREIVAYQVPGQSPDVLGGTYFGRVYRIDGQTGAMVWEFGGSFTAVNQVRLIEDINNDGLQEVLVSSFGNLFYCVSGADGTVLWQTFLGNFSWSGHAINDLTGDGVMDVLVANRNDHLYILNGFNGNIEFEYAMNSNVLQGATLVYPHEDLDGNGFVDILGAADDGRLVAISGGEMALAIENNSPNVPERFTLTQNFPNPFNPSTVFYVNMPATENAILEVFNALGQRVTELYRGKLTAGRHKFEFKAENLPSGIYFYRVVTQTQVLTRKMLLLR